MAQPDLFAAPVEPRKRRERRAPRAQKPDQRASEPAITPDQRRELLRCVRLGLELGSACASAGVSEDDVKADAGLLAEVVLVYRKGNSKLREQGLAIALSTKNASFLEKILDRRDAELTELRARVEPPAKARHSAAIVAEVREQTARLMEHMVSQDPVKNLAAFIDVALRPPTRLSAEAAAAARALLELLLAHPPLPYTPEWLAIEKAAGRNGYTVVRPAPAASAAGSAAVEPEVIPPPRRGPLEVLDPATPLPAHKAPVSYGVATERADAPWNVFSNS
jgi:hypothetical protein